MVLLNGYDGSGNVSHDPSQKVPLIIYAFDDNRHDGVHVKIIAFQQDAKIIRRQTFQAARSRVASGFYQNSCLLAHGIAHKHPLFL